MTNFYNISDIFDIFKIKFYKLKGVYYIRILRLQKKNAYYTQVRIVIDGFFLIKLSRFVFVEYSFYFLKTTTGTGPNLFN